MKKYFYSNNQEKEGPVSLEELMHLNIEPKTMIWYEGLEDWKSAESVEELKSLFELSPPPITSETDDEVISKSSISGRGKQRLFSNPFSFDGRIRRTEYGVSFIITLFAYTFINEIMKSGQYPMAALAYIPVYWFYLAQGAKRCHDYGSSGWWQLVPLCPFVMIFWKGQLEKNKYGYNPKY